MSRLAKSIRNHHEIARTRRAIQSAIDSAATPGMRAELLMIAQRSASRLI